MEITIGFMICRGWTDWTTTCYGYTVPHLPLFGVVFALCCRASTRWIGLMASSMSTWTLKSRQPLVVWHQLGAKKKYTCHIVWKPSLALAQCIIETLHSNSKSKYIYCILYIYYTSSNALINPWWACFQVDAVMNHLERHTRRRRGEWLAAICGVKIDLPKRAIPTPTGLGIWTKVGLEIWPLGMGTDLTSRGTQGVLRLVGNLVAWPKIMSQSFRKLCLTLVCRYAYAHPMRSMSFFLCIWTFVNVAGLSSESKACFFPPQPRLPMTGKIEVFFSPWTLRWEREET